MARKGKSTEEIITVLREADVRIELSSAIGQNFLRISVRMPKLSSSEPSMI